MRDDTILIAIEEAMGASARCDCGKELLLAEQGDTLWLECPTFAGRSRLPAGVAMFVRSMAHNRRPVASLPPTPAAIDATAPLPAPTVRPVVARG